MTTVEIDTDDGFEGYRLLIAEMETHELIELSELLTNNPTPTETVLSELEHRLETEQKLSSEEEKSDIKTLLE